MKLLIYIALFLAIWHFVYEGIIAPAIRVRLRNQLFSVRDDLRKAKLEKLSRSDERAFSFVHNGVNNFLNRLPNMTITAIANIRREIAADMAKQQLLDEHVNAVLNCENTRIRDAFKNANAIIEHAILTNMGGWFVYIIPAAMIIGGFKRLSALVSEIIVAPSKDVERLIPGCYA